MPSARAPAVLLPVRRPSPAAGVAFAAGSVALTTAALFPLREIAPPVSLGVVYLVAVLLVATWWGLTLSVATACACAVAFNFFHIPTTGRLTVAQGEDWVALGVFLVAAVLASSLADIARTRAAESERRLREAVLTAELARLLLGTADVRGALAPAARRIADALDVEAVTIDLDARPPLPARPGSEIFSLEAQGETIGVLTVGAALPDDKHAALEEVFVPSLTALLGAALQREDLSRQIVQSQALDDVKTALLRAVSHDLRSPLTTIVAAADALGSPALSHTDRMELADAVGGEGRRLSRLVEKLLDLSRLEAGQAQPRRDWCDLEDVLRTAVEVVPDAAPRVTLAIEADLPLIQADDAQLERAFANLVENGLRHSGGGPVSLEAHAARERILVRVVDDGPGIAAEERERIFEAFHRAPVGPGPASSGAGLGLAIARGLIEANGGTVHVESPPGGGACFVVQLPLGAGPAASGPTTSSPRAGLA